MNKAKKLSVLHLPKWYPNQFEPFDGNFIKNYIIGFRTHIHQTVLFVHSNSDLKESFKLSKTEKDGIDEVFVFFKKFNSSIEIINRVVNAYRYFKAQQLGFQSIKYRKFDLCHVHILSRPAMLALSLKQTFSIPFIISEHWTGYHAHVNKFNGFFRKKFAKYICKKSAMIHTVSAELKAAMQKHKLKGNYAVIPNVVDTKVFGPVDCKSDITKVIYVGNIMQHHKRILDIIQVAAELMNEGFSFELNLYGEGVDFEEAEACIKNLARNKEIKLLGTRDRKGIADAMASSNFLVLFSEFENQPCVINEALCCGIPVVVPNLKGIAENMQPEFGLTYKNNDKEAFKSAFETMLESHENYSSEKIVKLATQQYSETSIANRFLKIYRKAID